VQGAIDSLPDPTAARACLLAVARREYARLYQRERFETVDIAHIVVVDDPALASQADEDHSDARAAIVALQLLGLVVGTAESKQ
jgi:RNA polymerase sigma-70 factor (ECF subfamily)